MATKILEKTKPSRRLVMLERNFKELREDVEDHYRYLSALLDTRNEKRIPLEQVMKKYGLKKLK